MRILKWLLGIVAVAALAFFALAPGIIERGMNKVERASPWPVSAQAAALHKSLVIADLHSDTLLWKRDVDALAKRGHVDLPRLEAGNVALQVFSSVTKTPKGQNYEANSADTDNITLARGGAVAAGQDLGLAARTFAVARRKAAPCRSRQRRALTDCALGRRYRPRARRPRGGQASHRCAAVYRGAAGSGRQTGQRRHAATTPASAWRGWRISSTMMSRARCTG
jgi:hypothetical protein